MSIAIREPGGAAVRTSWWSASSLLLIVVALASCGVPRDHASALAAAAPGLRQALTAAGAVELAAQPALPLVTIDARFDADAQRITGHQQVWFPNTGTTAWPTIAVRLPGNGKAFNGAGIRITGATWDGLPLPEPESRHDGVGLVWRLPRSLAPGASGRLEFDFTTTISTTGGYHGLLARVGNGWCLYHWHPELPSWDGSDWRIPPMVPIGDQTQTGLMHVLLRLTLPAALQVAAGGSTIARETAPAPTGLERTCTIAAPLVRNLAMQVGRDLVCEERRVGGVVVRSWHGADRPRSGRRALDVAAASLALYDQRIAPYPYAELDVVEALQDDEVGGMESSGLVFIDGKAYAACEQLPEDCGPEVLPVFMLVMATAHEVGHQWFYTLAGNDSFRDGWLDESLTNWVGGWYCEVAHSPALGANALAMCLMEVQLPGEALTKAIDLPLDGYADMKEYGVVVYGRGALMYQALRREVGEERFFAFLRDYHQRHRFGVATPASWRACVERLLGTGRAAAFIATWVKGRGMTALIAAQASLPVVR